MAGRREPDLFAEYRSRGPSEPRASRPAGLVVRPAAGPDIESLAGLAHERQGGTHEQHRAGFEKEIAEIAGNAVISANAAGESHLLLVGEVAGAVVAFGRAKLFQPEPGSPANMAPAGWYLSGVIVAPALRRQGIAAELTLCRLEWIAARAAEAFYFANARNRVSIDLHARFGFTELTRDFVFPGVSFTGGVGILFRADLAALAGLKLDHDAT